MKKIFLSIGLMLATATAFATTQIQSNQDKPWRVFLVSDVQNLTATTDHNETVYENAWGNFEADGDDGSWQSQTWINDNHIWVSGFGGVGSEYNNWQSDNWDWQNNHTGSAGGMAGNMDWDWTGWGDEEETYNDGMTTTGFTNTLWIWGRIGNEHCNVSDPVNQTWDYDYSAWDDDNDRGSQHDTYTRTADTVWHVQTGGKAVPGLKNLWQFTGSASEILDKRAVPQFYGASMREVTNKTQIAIGSMGNLGTDGIRYNLLPNGIEEDVTPKVAGKDFYTFSVGGQKYLSYLDLYVQQANPGYSFIVYNSTNEVGHAFWQLRTEAPDDALQYISPSFVSFLNKKWGFSPINGLFTVPGVLQNDSEHSYNIKRTFFIGFNGLLNGLINTRSISNAPPVYSLFGFNCVSAARQIGYFSGVHVLPADMSPQNFGVTLIQMYPPILSSDPFDDETDVFYSPNLW